MIPSPLHAPHSARRTPGSRRRTLAVFAATFALGAIAPDVGAQVTPPAHEPARVGPESERDPKIYVLETMGRHGPSWFPRVRHPEVEYEAGDRLTFDRYHTVDVMYTWLRRWAERYPDIVELYQVGTSLEGRPILQVTLTNRATGPHTDKPAAFFEGGRHSGEVTSSESVLWLIQHLVEGYGRDREITALLDRAAIHLKPQNNPDGSNMYLHTAQTNRSSVRPMDNDGDGLMDEDPANDLDEDGVIRQMRWRDPNGRWKQDPRDPSGRLMVRAAEGEEGGWQVQGEGLDDDGDGRVDEDGIGGLDLHRNYPENWRPMPGRDFTGRGWTQGGAGAYPLSEPETRAVVLFLLEHPNVGVANSMDTRVPMHLRPPSTSKSEDSMFPEDLAHYLHFDSVGMSITGYPWAGDVYHTYSTRNNPEREGSPLFGHGPDFGYFYLGAIWYGDELWDGGAVGDLNGDGEEDDLDRLIWQDSVAAGREYAKPFKEWTAFKHPEFGDVEIGGWHPKFFSQNGPPEVLERWIRNQALFNLYMANSLPHLKADAPRVRKVSSDADSTTWEVTVTVRNDGRLPTALKQADRVKIVRPDRVELRVEGLRTMGDDRQLRWIEPAPPTAPAFGGGGGMGPGGMGQGVGGGAAAARAQVQLDYVQPGAVEEAVFTFRTYGVDRFQARYEILSTRGGVIRGDVRSGG